MELDDAKLEGLLGVCKETHDEEIDCEQFFALAARLVELRLSGVAPGDEFRAACEHERLCSHCREEMDALTEMVRAVE